MSCDVKKSSDIESVAADNMGGNIVAVPGSTSGNSIEKRTLPLLYVQSSINKPNISDCGNESLIPINVPKFGSPVTVSSVSCGIISIENNNVTIFIMKELCAIRVGYGWLHYF